MNKKVKITLLIIAVVIIAALVLYKLYKTNYLPSINLSSGSWLEDKDKNLEKKDEIISELPSNASTVRLNFPTSLSKVMISHKNGLGGLGVETNDSSVYNFVWMDIKADTEINSLASGKVTKVERVGLGEYKITIDYSYGLWGQHLGVAKSLVKEGDLVREGQPIALGLNGKQADSNLLAFSLADENIAEGTKSSFSNGVIVKPLDYFKPDVKAILLEKYR